MQQVERINELTKVGRTNWFSLLAYLVFAAVTILGVEDADFFLPGRNTQLPLVNVAIPTRSFFIFAPILGTALYVYLHLHLRKVIDELMSVKAKVGEDPVERHLNTWLLVDFILRRRGKGFHTPRKMDWLADLTTITLIWAAGPIVMGMFWFYSWPAHEEWLTVGILCPMLAITAYAGMTSWTQIRQAVNQRPAMTLTQLWCWIFVWCGIGFAGLLGLIKTETGLVREAELDPFSGLSNPSSFLSLAIVDFSGIEFPDLPPDQRNLEEARASFRAEWCNRRGMDEELCATIGITANAQTTYQSDLQNRWCEPRLQDQSRTCVSYFEDLSANFSELWAEYRTDQVAGLDPVDWSGRDLRNADLVGSNLRGANLQETRLAGADLAGAIFEEANLNGAQMQGADLSFAQMQGADLGGAGMQGAHLERAQMQGANLESAQMQGANLESAQMQGANLERAQMQGTILGRAQMQGANLERAQMQGAILDDAQMQGVILRRAQMQGAFLGAAQMQRAYLMSAQMQGAILWGAQMQGAILSGAGMQGADLRGAGMQGANLWRAQMQGADLRGAGMQGATLWRAQMQGADLRGAEINENTDLIRATLRGALMRSVDDITIAQLQRFIDEGDVLHDDETDLSDLQATWHAWQETLPDFDPSWRPDFWRNQ